MEHRGHKIVGAARVQFRTECREKSAGAPWYRWFGRHPYRHLSVRIDRLGCQAHGGPAGMLVRIPIGFEQTAVLEIAERT